MRKFDKIRFEVTDLSIEPYGRLNVNIVLTKFATLFTCGPLVNTLNVFQFSGFDFQGQIIIGHNFGDILPMSPTSTRSDRHRSIDTIGGSDADHFMAHASVTCSDSKQSASSLALSDPDEIHSQFSIAEAEELSAGLLQYFKQPEPDEADNPQFTAMADMSAKTPKLPPSSTHQTSPRLDHTHWMTRAMSADGARKTRAAYIEQNIKTHWIGLSLSSVTKDQDSAVVALEQWLNNSEGEICTPLVSVPTDRGLPPSATGERTKMQLYPLCPVAVPPPLPTSCTVGDRYADIGNANLHSNVATSESGNTTERGAIHNATAELLRPLLRQWLNNNMGLMVEKALAAEAAENARL